MQKLIPCRMAVFGFLVCCMHVHAQDPNDTEFRKGWVTYLRLDNGVISNFHAGPDLYAGGMQVNPQYTIVQHKLRIGANAGFVYGNKKFSGLAGPSLAFKLKSINLGVLAGLANLHVVGEHTWGTDKQRLAGGGIGLELLQKGLISLTTHRDYNLNNWWIQVHIGMNLKRNKTTTPGFNQ